MYAIVFHAHQKLDRVAHRHLRELLKESDFFPSLKQILHFEGNNGPDSTNLKRQTTGNQPWHFIDPDNPDDRQLVQQIEAHFAGLVTNLRSKDAVRSSFEAAWLAHALVDGLTPAHHYPYEKELAELRGDRDRNSRKGLVGRAFVKGDTMRNSLLQSMKLVGPKGLLTNHALFEGGAYSIIMPLRLPRARPTPAELKRVRQEGIVPIFLQYVQEVAALQLYDRYMESGWTQPLTRDVRRQLAPHMVRIISLAWYAAGQQAKAKA